jgi:hypothetical protein
MFIQFVIRYLAAKLQAIGSATFLPMNSVTDITSAIPAGACNIAKVVLQLDAVVIG